MTLPTPLPMPLRIDAYIDLVCPWCLIGKRHLQHALAQLAKESAQMQRQVQVELVWHSVQLLPHVPPQGVDFTTFYVERLGSLQAVQARQAQVLQAAARAGVAIHFERMVRMPNTRSAHQVLAFAQRHLDPTHVDALLDALFNAHFERGQDLNDMDLLRGLAAQHGLDLLQLDPWMQAGQGTPRPMDVPGVPLWVLNHEEALSGAQSSDVLLAWMRAALLTETSS